MIKIHKEYLAGVIDSDGSISICKRHKKRRLPNYTVMICLTWLKDSKSKKFMRELVEQFGGSYCQVTNHSGFNTNSQYLRYTAASSAANKILKFVKSSLRLKRQKCLNALELQKIIKPGKNRSKLISNKLERLYRKNLNDKNSR